MPHYVSLLRYTQQGAAKIKENPTRLDAAKKAAAPFPGASRISVMAISCGMTEGSGVSPSALSRPLAWTQS